MVVADHHGEAFIITSASTLNKTARDGLLPCRPSALFGAFEENQVWRATSPPVVRCSSKAGMGKVTRKVPPVVIKSTRLINLLGRQGSGRYNWYGTGIIKPNYTIEESQNA